MFLYGNQFGYHRFYYPNELIDEDGEEIPLAHPDDAYAFDSNGKTFYFRKSKVDAYDNNVRGYYSAGAHITGIIYATNNNISEQSETFPAKMTYLPWATNGCQRTRCSAVSGA